MKRYASEPAFILHHYDWSESSLILEVFTRTQGRITLVAKGAKKPTSNFRAVLLPLQRLELAYSMAPDSEIGTLKSAEWTGGYTLPQGDALLAGYYCNELLLKLLAREDAQPDIFDAYATCVALLAMQGKNSAGMLSSKMSPLQGEVLASVDAASILRAFELCLLRVLGLLPDLHTTTTGHQLATHDAQHYQLHAERGLRLAASDANLPDGLPATLWLALHNAMQYAAPMPQLLTVLAAQDAATKSGLRHALRMLVQHHVAAPLRTRQLMADLQAL